MKNKLIKLPLLLVSLISLAGCYTEESSDNNFVVNLLKVGNDYKINDFTVAYSNYLLENNIHYENDTSLTVGNMMPNNIFDKYGVGIYTVETVSDSSTMYNAFIYYNKAIYPVSAFDNPEKQGLGSVAITDVNKDGQVEVTTSFFTSGNLKASYLSTLDTMSLQLIRSTSFFNKELTFKEKDNQIEIYDDKECISMITLYDRSYELSKPNIALISDNYEAKVSMSRYLTLVPVDYINLEHTFIVETEMTYTGETFTYSGSSTLDNAVPKFKMGDVALETEVTQDTDIVDITITKGQSIKGTFRFVDTATKKSQKGTYDLEVSYRNEVVIEKAALIVK